ncbi:REP-associated tyrosine transposase [Arenimonas sp.]|uniref:REP-associated tyrosine transposase n=1 Tax=Arenimonas sp. TaxID=1872635 RepID=UPI0039E2C2B0
MAIASDKSPVDAGVGDSRRERVSVAGQAYYLTVSTLFRRPVFSDHEAARAVAALHAHPPVWGRSRCLAWVLMPDHWHGLVELGAGDSLEGLMRRFKSISARAVEARHRINGWLWSRGFHDRALRDDESKRKVARYLVATPLRLGLVQNVGDYPYWDAIWLETNGGSPASD